jgi:hypothetical protein
LARPAPTGYASLQGSGAAGQNTGRVRSSPRDETQGPAPMYFGAGYIGKGDFWKFGLIFGVIQFAGLLLVVMPWLQLTGW